MILMGVIDNIMIGQLLDKNALAAASLGNALSFLISSLAFGGIPVVAPIFARNVDAKSHTILRLTLQAVGLISFLLTLLSLLIYWFFENLGQIQQIEGMAKSYFLIITISNIPLFFFLVYKQLFDGTNRPYVGMWITFIGLILNVIFNYFLIEIFSLNGAGYATLLTRIFMLSIIYFFVPVIVRVKSQRNFFGSIKENYVEILSKVKLILYTGVQVFFEIGAFTFAVIMMGWISSTALASHQIAINIAAIAYMMATGVAYAAGIRIGDNLKRKSYSYAKLSGSVALILVFVMMILTASLILVFRIGLVHLYIENQEVEILAAQLLIIAALFQISDGVQAVALGCLRGLTDVKIPAILTFVAYWIISLPVGYYLGFETDLGARGIWYGLLTGLSFAAVFLVFRFYTLINKKKIAYLE